MTDKEKIRKEVERLRHLHQMKYQQLNTNDNMCLVECGKRNLCNELLSFIDSLQDEPVSEELEKAYNWKPADGDDLPEIDREVVALLDNGKVVFAHRPPEYWDGKDIVTGKVTRNYPKTYDKSGWNIPNVKYWLDCSMPKEIEL